MTGAKSPGDEGCHFRREEGGPVPRGESAAKTRLHRKWGGVFK